MTNGQNPHIVRLPGTTKTKTREKSVRFLNIYLSGCSAPMCPLETFIQLYQSKLPGDMNEECQSKRIKRK